MLRASPPLSVGQASHYYRSEFSRGDYYTERESEGIVASRWHGEGARKLGLSGRVKADEFARLLEGRNPSGREVLVAHREGLSERRAGWDVTISPHKSVSLQALVGGDSRLLEAHDRAVTKALSELERHAQAWIHGGRDVETTAHVVAGSFRHETSRALDPQLHSHCVVLNMTQRADGEWRAVDARGIFRAQRLAREIYESELGRELRQLGYETKTYRDGRTGRDRAVGIAGFQPVHLKHFSKRSREIEKALQAGGLKSRLHGSRVTVATRQAKQKGIDREALLWKWRTTAKEMGIEFPRWSRERAERAKDPLFASTREQARAAVKGAVDHLSERRTVFRVADLEKEALERGRERGVTLDDVRKEIASHPDLVVADRADAVVARVTTTEAIGEERALVDAVARARGRGPTLTSPVAARGLGDDQLKVMRHILGGPDRIVAVEGKAGTGKSTALSAVREHAQAAGWTVRGFAPTTTAAGVLREGGIDATTVAAALKEPPSLKSDRPELWIVDEAGLLSTRQARELLERAEQVGAKVVLVGDRAQHRAVEAGSPFSLLIDRGGIATERLDVIRRQRDEGLREVVKSASEAGGSTRAVQLLERGGKVVEIADARRRHEAITRDFVMDGGRGVVIAPSNAERADLNRRIREALIETGRVERKSVKAPVVVKLDLTVEQRGRAASYEPGDVLRFVRRGDGIEAGERARVVSVDEAGNRLRVTLERTGMPATINPRQRRAFEVERLEDRRFAVGDRIQFRERDRGLDVANGTIGTIKKLDHAKGIATVEVGPRRFPMDLKQPRALDHAYAVTSHKSQGLSRERVYLTVDTRHSEELVNRRQFYVSVSRAVDDARVYTDDRMALSRAVSREQARENALAVADRAASSPRLESRAAALKQERALDLVARSIHEPTRGSGRADGRALGGDRRGEGLDRGTLSPVRGAEGPAGAPGRASGPERGRAQGADRVPGPRHAGAAGPGRAAADADGGRRGRDLADAVGPHQRDAAADGRGGPAAGDRDVAARMVADGPGDRGRDGGRVAGRPDRELPHGLGPEPLAGERAERGAHEDAALPARQPAALDHARALSKGEIAKSPELRRAYADEYAAMLRLYPDRELAKAAARVNVSALAAGHERIVTPGGGWSAPEVGQAIARGGQDLGRIARALTPAVERAPLMIERLITGPPRGLGPER